MDEKVREILIDVLVDTKDSPISVEDFNDKFIEWIESNNWCFGGMIGKYIEETE